MDDLVTWMRAQLDADEQSARDTEGDGRWECPSTGVLEVSGIEGLDGLVLGPRGVLNHAATFDPDRTLNEVQAKRYILDQVVPLMPEGEARERLVKLLAYPYTYRPGWRLDWAPSLTFTVKGTWQ